MYVLIATGLFPPDIGGPATYSQLLMSELPGRGIDVSVLSYGSVRHLPKGVSHLTYFLHLLFKGFRADIIFAQDPVSVGLPSLIAAKLLHKRFIVKIVGDYAWEQGTIRYGIEEPLDTFSKKKAGYAFFVRLFKIIETWVATQADSVIVPSKYLKGIVANWGIGKEKITVIYNAFEAPRNIATKEVLRELMQLRGKVIISVGRLVPWKGFDTLIEIVPILKKTFRDLKVFIVGSGPREDVLKKKIQDHSLEEHVVLVGQLDHETLLRYLKASDIFVLNTAYEGFSHQILECMALGVPVVTTRVGGNKEIINHEQNGVLTKYNDRENLWKNITRVLNNSAFSKQLTTKAKETIKRYNTKIMLDNLCKVLESV